MVSVAHYKYYLRGEVVEGFGGQSSDKTFPGPFERLEGIQLGGLGCSPGGPWIRLTLCVRLISSDLLCEASSLIGLGVPSNC